MLGDEGEDGVRGGGGLGARAAKPVCRTSVLGLVEMSLHVPASGERLK